MVRVIPLTQNKVAFVDDDVYVGLSKHKWFAVISAHTTYAVRYDVLNRYVYMHREVMCVTDPSLEVDHKNRDGLDNQRHNLRTVDSSTNMFNRRTPINNKSTGIRGISRNHKRYRVRVVFRGRYYIDQNFDTLEQAQEAWLKVYTEIDGG